MNGKNKNWTRDQLLVCFNFYCRTPFGKFYSRNPEIIRIAGLIGRTPSAVAMKLSNLASFDPNLKERKIKGLSNASQQDRIIWEEFNADPNQVAAASEEAALRFGAISMKPEEVPLTIPSGPSEAQMTRPMRLLQGFFRKSVLASYRFTCAFCGLNIPALLNASHIIPWSVAVDLRADPRNGLCLCALHDRAFDRKLMSVDSKYRLVLSSRLEVKRESPLHEAAFLSLKGKKMIFPGRFLPHQSALQYHFSAFSEGESLRRGLD